MSDPSESTDSNQDRDGSRGQVLSLQSSRASLSSSESHCRPSPRSPPITFPDEIEVGEQRIPCEKRLRSWVWYSRASAQWSALHRRARALHRRITQALGQRGSHNKVGLRRRCCWWVLVVFGNRRLHKAARDGEPGLTMRYTCRSCERRPSRRWAACSRRLSTRTVRTFLRNATAAYRL